jgi:hypothetical protein
VRPSLPIPYIFFVALAGPVLGAPPEAVAIAAGDVRTLPRDAAIYTRYLDLTHLPADDRQQVAEGVGRLTRLRGWQALSYHTNCLSREPDIVQPRKINGGAVLAIDLRDFAIDPKVFGKLGTVEAREPYFHVVLEKTETYTVPSQPQQYVNNGYGQPIQPAAPQTRKVRYSAAAPWLPAADISELINRTQSQVPIVRGDWFFVQTAIQEDRVAGYYDFLGLGKKDVDFLKLIGADVKKAKELKLEAAASVAKSGVANHNRGIRRLQSLTGGYWFTQDYFTSTNKQNVARLLDGDTDPPQGDASEQYGPLPNRLFAYWLEDKNGDRQNFVPQKIATDGKTTSNDRNIYAGTMSCTRCHVEGLRPIDDFVRSLYRDKLQLRSPDYNRFKRLRQLYLTDLPAQLSEDNARFSAAVKQCNGLTLVENSRVVAALWQSYQDEPVTPATAAAELGTTEADVIAKCRAYVDRGGIVDPIPAAFAKDPPISIPRDYFEEQYPLFVSIIGAKP